MAIFCAVGAHTVDFVNFREILVFTSQRRVGMTVMKK